MSSTRISRRVNAPRAIVYRALLDARAVATWMLPTGMTSHVHAFDAREGGSFRISLTYDERQRSYQVSTRRAAGTVGPGGGCPAACSGLQWFRYPPRCRCSTSPSRPDRIQRVTAYSGFPLEMCSAAASSAVERIFASVR
jgi:hypothetical protein